MWGKSGWGGKQNTRNTSGSRTQDDITTKFKKKTENYYTKKSERDVLGRTKILVQADM